MIKFEVGKEYLVDWEIELGRFDDETICVARTEDTVTFRYDDPYWKRTFFFTRPIILLDGREVAMLHKKDGYVDADFY